MGAEGWVALAPAAAVENGRATGVWVGSRELVVWRRPDGGLCVMDAACPHRGNSLAGAEVAGDTITCPVHKWVFDGVGRNVQRADGRPLLDEAVRCYAVVEADGQILADVDPHPVNDVLSPRRR